MADRIVEIPMTRLNHQNPPMQRRNYQNQVLPVVIRRDSEKKRPKINGTLATISSFLVTILLALFVFLYSRALAKKITDKFGVKAGCFFLAIGVGSAIIVIVGWAFSQNDMSENNFFMCCFWILVCSTFASPILMELEAVNNFWKLVIPIILLCLGVGIIAYFYRKKLSSHHFPNDCDTSTISPLLNESDTETERELIILEKNDKVIDVYENVLEERRNALGSLKSEEPAAVTISMENTAEVADGPIDDAVLEAEEVVANTEKVVDSEKQEETVDTNKKESLSSDEFLKAADAPHLVNDSGAGCGNWGPIDDAVPEAEEIVVADTEKVLDSEKQEETVDTNKEKVAEQNWGPIDDAVPEAEEVVADTEKVLDSEKQEETVDTNKVAEQNWGPIDDAVPEAEEVVADTEKVLDSGKQEETVEQKMSLEEFHKVFDEMAFEKSNKAFWEDMALLGLKTQERKVELEEKRALRALKTEERKVALDYNTAEMAKQEEPEKEEMTYEEYEKVLEQRKALVSRKTEERKVVLDKDFAKMQLLSVKKYDDEIFVKLGTDKDKKKDADLIRTKRKMRRESKKSQRSLSIGEFLKPA